MDFSRTEPMPELNENCRRQQRLHSFWERMADRYPSPFDDKSLTDTGKVIDLVEARGAKIDGAAILDIGCGNGMYSLPLARRAAWVTGLDFSAGMLARLEQMRAKYGITNVSTMQSSWKEADIVALNLESSFDIVWTSMTPAVREAEDIIKMRRCAKGWCVYIGWGKVRKNELLEEVFRTHGHSFGPPPGTAAVQSILKTQGIATEMDLLKTYWDWEGSLDEAINHVTDFFEVQSGKTAQPEIIRSIVRRFSEKKRVKHRTEVEMGILVWREE
jgi:SAM-dependent methyltransferase